MDDAELRVAILQIANDSGSIEEFKQRVGKIDSRLRYTSLRFDVKEQALGILFAKDIVMKFMDFTTWRALAKRPKDFDKELDKWLDEIRQLMRFSYGILAVPHRPVEHAQRDVQIEELKKQHPTWSYQRIGNAMTPKLPGKVVREAYERRQKRSQKDWDRFRKAIIDIFGVRETFGIQEDSLSPPST